MKNLPWIIIALLLLVILYLRECSPKPECPPPSVRVDTIPGDTIIKDTTIYKPHLVYRDTGSCRFLTQNIDTVAILAACLAVNHYRDTLMNDTSALVIIENEVSMNELQRTRMEFLNRREKLLINNMLPMNKPKFKINPGITIGKRTGELTIGATIMIRTAKRNSYCLSYGSDSHLEISIFWDMTYKK